MELTYVYRVVNIEFTRPKTLFAPLSHIIRLVEGTKYSHVRLNWESSQGTNIVYEASGMAVKFLGPVAQEDKPVEVLHRYRVALNKEEYQKLLSLCIYNSGIQYGFTQLLGILLAKIFRKNVNILSKGNKAQVCSEVVGRFLQEVLNIGHELNLDIAGPRDIKLELDKYSHRV